jgi:putative lipoprotein
MTVTPVRSLLCSLSLALAGCSTAATDSAAPSDTSDFQPDSRPLATTLVYECTGLEFVTRVGPGEMALWLEDRYVVLSQVRSASGTKYQEGDLLFWSKGDEAMLEIDGVRYEDCRLNPARAPWEDARRRGVDFRAVGNEPGWYLEIREGENLLLVLAYGTQRVLLDAPRRVALGEERVYSAGEGDRQVRVLVSPAFCTDTMSGESFPSTVSVDWQGQQLQGCGRDLDHPWE